MVYVENNLETNCPVNGWVNEEYCADCPEYNDCSVAMRFDDELLKDGWVFDLSSNSWIQDKNWVEQNSLRYV